MEGFLMGGRRGRPVRGRSSFFFLSFFSLFPLRASKSRAGFPLFLFKPQASPLSLSLSSLSLIHLPPAGASVPAGVPRGRPGARHDPSFNRDSVGAKRKGEGRTQSMARKRNETNADENKCSSP